MALLSPGLQEETLPGECSLNWKSEPVTGALHGQLLKLQPSWPLCPYLSWVSAHHCTILKAVPVHPVLSRPPNQWLLVAVRVSFQLPPSYCSPLWSTYSESLACCQKPQCACISAFPSAARDAGVITTSGSQAYWDYTHHHASATQWRLACKTSSTLYYRTVTHLASSPPPAVSGDETELGHHKHWAPIVDGA